MEMQSIRLASSFFNDTATTEIYTLSLHDALPICGAGSARTRGGYLRGRRSCAGSGRDAGRQRGRRENHRGGRPADHHRRARRQEISQGGAAAGEHYQGEDARHLQQRGSGNPVSPMKTPKGGEAGAEGPVLKLKVTEALSKDVGRGIARMGPEDLEKLQLAIGDMVEVTGKRATVCKAMPAHKELRGQSRLQIDGLVRENAGTGLDELVMVRKTSCRPADSVVLAPANVRPSERDMDRSEEERRVG